MLVVAFISIMAITFGAMALMTRPSKGQKAIERRLVELRPAKSDAGSRQAEVSLLLKRESSTQFGWLDEILQKYQITQSLEARIVQADSRTTVAKLFLSALGCGVLGFLVALMFVPVLAVQLICAAIFAYVPFAFVSFKRSRRINAFNKCLPDAIDMMGRALRAGHSMIASIDIVAKQSLEPLASEFGEVFKQQNFGVPLRDALQRMLDHVPSQDLRVLVTGILVQKETGGNLAEILDRTVAVIRDRMRIQGEIKTHTAQGRMTGYILCSLPIVMLVVINLVNPGYSKILTDTPLGHKLIYIGLFLLTTGGLIIRAIINGIEV